MHRQSLPSHPPRTAVARLAALGLVAALVGACDAGGSAATPPITPGTSTAPREVNIVTRDYAYVPSVMDLHPGETVLLHVINAGLVIHEAILGDMEQQLAWEAAEAPYADPPPGPTPLVGTPPGFDGVRVVVGSGQRVDVTWMVPDDAAADPSGWWLGCHIPGHWMKGMVAPVRFVDDGGVPLASGSPGASTAP